METPDSGQVYVRLVDDGRTKVPIHGRHAHEVEAHQCTVVECCCCPCICALACVGCVVGTVALCVGSCVFSVLQCFGCAPEVRLEHIEKFVYGKELWQAFLDGEGCGPEDPARGYCEAFFASARFSERIDKLFDQYDTDGSGKLDRDEVVEMLSGLSTALVATMSGVGPEIVENSAEKEKIREAYVKMFEDKKLELDRQTFLALAKLITAQLVLSASASQPDTFYKQSASMHQQEKSTVKIEELDDDGNPLSD